MVGVGLITIVIVAVLVQPLALVPVTVYVVVLPGLAITCEPVVALRPVAGLQVYVEAPLAIIPIVSLLHIAGDIPVIATVTVGVGLTVTVTLAESVHPPLAPYTSYVVVPAGLAVGLGHVVQLNPVPGFQVYVAAPPAFSTILLPEHIAGFEGTTVTFSDAATVTVTVCVLVHPAEVPVTVYVVVEPGLAVTVAPVVALRPVPGDHVYVVPPLAVNDTLPPGQIVGAAGATVTVGVGLTVRTTVCVPLQPVVVPVTVYVVVVVALLVTLAPVVALRPVAGLHV